MKCIISCNLTDHKLSVYLSDHYGQHSTGRLVTSFSQKCRPCKTSKAEQSHNNNTVAIKNKQENMLQMPMRIEGILLRIA